MLLKKKKKSNISLQTYRLVKMGGNDQLISTSLRLQNTEDILGTLLNMQTSVRTSSFSHNFWTKKKQKNKTDS